MRSAGVADDLHDEAIAVTHGHPLALSLLLDVLSQRRDAGGGAPLDLDVVPDVVERLMTCFAAEVPSPRHRRSRSRPTPASRPRACSAVPSATPRARRCSPGFAGSRSSR